MKLLTKLAPKILAFWLIVLFILYATLSIVRHNNFQSGGFDLGIFDQAVWQYSQFQYPYNTIKERFILGDHLTLTLPLLAPLFWIWDDARVLLIFQAFWLTFSTVAVYKVVKLRGFSSITALNLSIIYSLFYGIQSAVFFDFHPVIIGAGLLPWLVYFLETKKRKLFLTALVLLLLTQENMGIALASLGFIYLFRQQYRRWGLIFIMMGVPLSILAIQIIAAFSPVGYEHAPRTTLDSLNIVNFFDSEEKRQTWLYSLSSFSFLPLFSIGSMFATVTDLSQYFLTGEHLARAWGISTHHRAILAIFLLLGTLDTLAFLKRKKFPIEKFSFLLLIIALGLQYAFHLPLNKLSKPSFWKTEAWMSDNHELFKVIPKGASIATQHNLVPHLSHRKEIYLIWPRQHDFEKNSPCGQKTCWWIEFGGKPEYLVVNMDKNQSLIQFLESPDNFESAVINMQKSGKIILEKEVGNAKLYRINYSF